MGYEYFVERYEQLAREHDQMAERLVSIQGDPTKPSRVDLQNGHLSKMEKIEAEHCRLVAQDYRNRSQK